MQKNSFDAAQTAAAAQFDRQSDRYGRSHILADTSDVAMALDDVAIFPGGRALDVATGGGHTALFLAKRGLEVTAGDIALRMLEKNSLIKVKRGGILIVDREGLEACSNGSYGTAEAELRRLTS